jgi:hypothetical protein
MGEVNLQANELNTQALLFLSGEMNADSLTAFEERLASDSAYQDALIAAVELWPGLADKQPDPRYRQRVIESLRHLRQPRVVVVSHRHDRRRSFVWALVGGVAAAVLITIINPGRWFAPSSGPTFIVNTPPESGSSPAATEVIYSDLSNVERLSRVRSEQEQRRQKQEELKMHHPLLHPAAPASGGKSMM